MERSSSVVVFESDLNLKATELRLGLPGTDESDQQQSPSSPAKNNKRSGAEDQESGAPATK